MQLLKDRILLDGKVVGTEILMVDSFLNHQIDVELLNEMGKEFKSRFDGEEITKILTIEASGIAIAIIAAQYFKVPVVFAKKHVGTNMDKNAYEAKVFSFTKNTLYKIRVSKKYINVRIYLYIFSDMV